MDDVPIYKRVAWRHRAKVGEVFAVESKHDGWFVCRFAKRLPPEPAAMRNIPVVYVFDTPACKPDEHIMVAKEHLLIGPMLVPTLVWTLGYALRLRTDPEGQDVFPRHCFATFCPGVYVRDDSRRVRKPFEPVGAGAYHTVQTFGEAIIEARRNCTARRK